MKRSCQATLLGCCCFLGPLLCSGAEVPESILKGLGSERFEQREEAQRQLSEWASGNDGELLGQLLKLSKEHSEAEVRMRALDVLRAKVGEIYATAGQGYLGIRMEARFMNLPDKGDRPSPVVMITEVVEDSAADRAGMMVGDCITSVAGKDIAEISKNQVPTEALMQWVKDLKPGSQVDVSILRGGEPLVLPVTLKRRPAALDDLGINPTQKEIKELEEQMKEEHFKKWLAEKK